MSSRKKRPTKVCLKNLMSFQPSNEERKKCSLRDLTRAMEKKREKFYENPIRNDNISPSEKSIMVSNIEGGKVTESSAKEIRI